MDKDLEWNYVNKSLILQLEIGLRKIIQVILTNVHELDWAATAILFM